MGTTQKEDYSMITQQFKCDSCGTVKQESNHWFLVTHHAEGYIVLAQWSGAAHTVGIKHYCGAGCLGKAVSLWAANND
jgi:hypothetical protein